MSTSPTKRHTPAQVCRNANLPSPIPLYQVAVLAATVHQYALNYKIDDTNCYFYAEAIMKVLQEYHGAQITRVPKTLETGKALETEKALETGKAPMVQGTLISNICSKLPDQMQISAIINEYVSALEHFERSVRSIIFLLFWESFLTFDVFRLGRRRPKYVI